MKMEAMAGYPRNMRMTRPPVDEIFLQLQGQILALTKNIQELTTQRPG
jgi:hypothetical protein